MSRSFKKLIVWQKAFALGIKVYRCTENFPSSERYGLTSQMRRSSVSIVSNIAEGYSRFTSKSYANFLTISLGSEAELETQILFATELRYLSPEKSQELLGNLSEVGRLLTVSRKSLLAPS